MKWPIIEILLVQLFNALLAFSQLVSDNKPIRVIPPDVACSKGDIKLPLYLERLYWDNFPTFGDLKVTCLKNNSCKTTTNVSRIFSYPGIINIGQDGCNIPSGTTGSPAALNGPTNDQSCYTDLSIPYLYPQSYTLLLKFKPGSPKARGTLLVYNNLKLNVEEGKLFIMNSNYGNTNHTELLLKDGWNNIAIQANVTSYDNLFSIFLEGDLIAIVPLYYPPRQDGQGYATTLRLGITPVDEQGLTNCLVVKSVVCRSLNVSAFYSLPNRFTSNQDENDRMFQQSLEATIKTCPNSDRQRLEHYLCSLYYPPCRNMGLIEPCPSFCQDIITNCPQLTASLGFNCSSLSVRYRSCTGYSQTGPNLLKGEVGNIEFYEGTLVDQIIYRQYKTLLPDVSYPECLCPPNRPHLRGAYCYDDTRTFYPRIPSVGVTGGGKLQNRVLMVNFLKEYMNDGNLRPFGNKQYDGDLTAWFSAPGTEKFTVIIELKETILIDTVDIYLLKPMPNKRLSIEIRRSNEWKMIHHFANDCNDLGFPPFVIAERPGIVGCTPYSMASAEGIGIDSMGRLSWTLFNETFGFNSYASQNDQRILELYRTDAISFIFDGPPLGNFTNDEENYHGISEINVLRRNFRSSSCNCNSDGIEGGRGCGADFQCPCRPELDPKKAGKQCLPYIDKLYPTYGPQVGGTLIVILGGWFVTRGLSITIDNQNCPVNSSSSNATLIVCRTEALGDSGKLGLPLVIRIHLPSQMTINYRYPFIYKPNPVITDIYPRESITVGGVLQTVIGENLDSVAFPKLLVYMKDINQPNIQYLGPNTCYVRNSILMECLTPEIPLPTSHVNLQQSSSAQQDVALSPGNSGLKMRATTRNWINDNQLDWHLGLLLDGVNTYLNLSESLPGKSQLLIFTTPIIYPFKPEVLVFKLHKGQRSISVQGEKLQYGVQEDDYHIKIGQGICELRQLLNNLLVCVPPSEDVPLAKETDIHESGGLRVQVRIGEEHTVHVGFLKYEFTLWDDPAIKGGIIAGIVIFLILLILAYPAYKFIKSRRKAGAGFGHSVSYHRKENPYEDKRDLLSRIDPGLREKIKPTLINADRLTLYNEIGKGNFGVVYIGDLKSSDNVCKVAVKTIKEQDATLTMITEFLGEACVMKEFDHKNVLSLTGIVIKVMDVYVILPFMENGSLKDFVQTKKNTFTVLDLVHLCSQACEGMAYLESQKFVHRDLAARNCMVDDHKLVKIADFGLARDIYEQEYYRPEDTQRPLPYKWMAIECIVLDSKKFTTKSDVWSFGVLFWEVMTRGRTPYSEIPANQLGRFLRSNGRLEKPCHCPADIYEMMMSCWRANPNDRPDFIDLVETFEELLGPYFASNNVNNVGYTRISKMAKQDIQSSNERYDYSASNYAPDYLQLIETPTIDDLLLPAQPEVEQNGAAQQPDTLPHRGQHGALNSASNANSTSASNTPPPAPHNKPQLPKDGGYMLA